MSTGVTKTKQTALIALDSKVGEAAELLRDGDSYYGRAGTLLLEVKAECSPLEFKALLVKHDIGFSTARRWMQFAQDRVAELEYKAKDLARNNAKNAAQRDARNSERDPSNHANDLAETDDSDDETFSPPSHSPTPSPSAAGEIHEAVRGFKAATQRMRTARRAGEARKALDWHTVSLQHFRFLVTRSNLPSVSGMTTDQIIETLTF